MKTAGIRELKAHLSSYLQEVQRGEALLITDRGRVVAEVRRPGDRSSMGTPEDLRYAELVQRGRIRPASAPDDRSWAEEWEGLGARKGTAKAVLDADRDE